MSFNRDVYRALRVSRALKAAKRGRIGAYARRSLLSTVVAKLTAGWRR